MGIKNLSKVLGECKTVQIKIDEFKGKCIAVDAMLICYKYMAGALKDTISSTTINLVNNELDRDVVYFNFIKLTTRHLKAIKNRGITPWMVFDNDDETTEVYQSKLKTKQLRTASKDQSKTNIEIIRRQLSQLNPLTEEYDKLYSKLKDLIAGLSYITKSEINTFKSILSLSGYKVLQSSTEGEKLCAMLARENKVAAVLTKDTDSLVYGAPITITDIDFRSNTVSCMLYNYILQTLNLNQEQFLDLCITLGCDFNTNMYRIGAVKSLELIRGYGNIDNYPLDVSCLNHHLCRKIFSYELSYNICTNYKDIDTDTIVDHNNLKLYLEDMKLTNIYTELFEGDTFSFNNIPNEPIIPNFEY